MSDPIRFDPPASPERGPCEEPVRHTPAKMPQETPVPMQPEREPILVPNWPAPVEVPRR